MPSQSPADPGAARRRVPVGVAFKRVLAAFAFWVNFRGTCIEGGYFEPGYYHRAISRSGSSWGGRVFARLWPLMHYLLFGYRDRMPPASRYDHDRAVARFPFHKWVRLSPLEAYVLFGRLTGGEFFGAEEEAPVVRPSLPVPRADTVLVVHAYHLLEFEQILGAVAALDWAVDVVVTTSHPGERVAALCEGYGVHPTLIHVGPNRGRDVAPFCRLLNAGLLDSYAVVGKIHTKRSAHRADGADWFTTGLNGLLSPQCAAVARTTLTGPQGVGIVAPPGRLGPDPGRSANRHHMAVMCARSGLPLTAIKAYSFPHGTMFWARSAALRPLAELALSTEDFEVEAGQLDGTLAHAVERMIGVYCRARGYTLIETTL